MLRGLFRQIMITLIVGGIVDGAKPGHRLVTGGRRGRSDESGPHVSDHAHLALRRPARGRGVRCFCCVGHEPLGSPHSTYLASRVCRVNQT